MSALLEPNSAVAFGFMARGLLARGNPGEAGRFKVTEATFTYVAVDDEGNKRPVRPV